MPCLRLKTIGKLPVSLSTCMHRSRPSSHACVSKCLKVSGSFVFFLPVGYLLPKLSINTCVLPCLCCPSLSITRAIQYFADDHCLCATSLPWLKLQWACCSSYFVTGMSGSVAYVRPVFERLAPQPGSLVERILLQVSMFQLHSCNIRLSVECCSYDVLYCLNCKLVDATGVWKTSPCCPLHT